MVQATVSRKDGSAGEPVMRVAADCTSEQTARFLRNYCVTAQTRRRRADLV